MKNGGLIPWNAIAFFQTSKTSSRKRQLRTKDDLENHLRVFGAMVEYHPFSIRDQSKLHQFGKKVLPEICLGHALIAERIWKGDIRIADLHELEKLDAPEICPRRVNAKEVLISENGDYSQ